jgi:putative OPT family oligopeptide transporter
MLGQLGDSMAGMGVEIQISGIAALFGLGYIIGIKYTSIIASGSVLAFLVMVPLVFLFGKQVDSFEMAGVTYDVANMSAGQIFGNFIKPIGIGAIAISGLIGILRMWKIVASSVTLGFKGLKKGGAKDDKTERTQLDLSPKTVLLAQLVTIVGMALLFFVIAKTTPLDALGNTYSLSDSLLVSLVGSLVGFLLRFLFTPVAAQAIAIVGVNPVSGMTLITVVLSVGAMVIAGLGGSAGMIVALVIGTAVCTALSTSGALITDFKIGYWIGSTPRNQEKWKFLGILVSAAVVALLIPLMDSAYHFLVQDPVTGMMVSNEQVLPAPQANMIAAVTNVLMDDPAKTPWLLYGLGAIVAILLLMAGVPMLAFALGMYLPLSINMAMWVGAACAFLIAKTGGSKKVRKTRAEQGTLIASGLMAGAALFGILTAVLRLPAINAPIQYLSVGADFHLEAVVSTPVVDETGKPAVDENGSPKMSSQTVFETVLDGKIIKRRIDEEGLVVSMPRCHQIELKEGQECNENLVEQRHKLNQEGKPKLDAQGQPEEMHVWYAGQAGRWGGLGMLFVLAAACFLLARKGASWQLAADASEEEAKPEERQG